RSPPRAGGRHRAARPDGPRSDRAAARNRTDRPSCGDFGRAYRAVDGAGMIGLSVAPATREPELPEAPMRQPDDTTPSGTAPLPPVTGRFLALVAVFIACLVVSNVIA